jgi:cytochrome c553
MRRASRIAVLLLLGSAAASRAGALEPHVNYQVYCMGCHLADGSGVQDRVPSMRRTLVKFSAMPEGREFLVRVPGAAQSPLSDADLATLMNWMVRNLSELPVPGDFVEYTAAEVGRVRHQPLVQVVEQRRRLLTLAGE